MSDEDFEDDGYEMVMPFVVCRTQGGPYEDESFVAGFQAGQLDEALGKNVKPLSWDVTVCAALLPQIELIAMKHGYVMQSRIEDEWAFVTCRLEREDGAA